MSDDSAVHVKRRWIYLFTGLLSLMIAFFCFELELGTIAVAVWLVCAAFWLSCFHLAGRISRGEYDSYR